MDGNPDVHAKTIRETLARQQQVIVGSYYDECQQLAQRLSQSASRIGVSAELGKRIEEYMRLLPGARAITPARHDRMPYRVFLAQIGERLRGMYEGRANGYESARQFRDDVTLIATSLQANKGANAGLFYVRAAAAPHRHLRVSSGDARCAPARRCASPGHRARLRRSAAGSTRTSARAARAAGASAREGSRARWRARCARQAHARRVRGDHAGPAPLRAAKRSVISS